MPGFYTALFLFVSGIVLNGVTAQESRVSERNKALAKSKCEEYKTPLNKKFEILPLVAGAQVQSVSVPICDEGGEPLIVGGQPALDGEFPHMAAIGYRNPEGGYLWLCGGTLISNRYVLSAAHCVSERTYGVAQRVRLGSTDLDGHNPNLQEFNIEKYIRHENYTRRTKYHDIALFKLDKEVQISKKVRPACLFTEDTNNSGNVIATGWGRTEQLGPTSRKMLKVGLQIYPTDTCQKTYRDSLKNGLTSDMLCVGHQAGGRDTCDGDSGGPLVVSEDYNQCIYYVVGVTSIGKYCGAENLLSVYTNVSAYTDWIVDKIW